TGRELSRPDRGETARGRVHDRRERQAEDRARSHPPKGYPGSSRGGALLLGLRGRLGLLLHSDEEPLAGGEQTERAQDRDGTVDEPQRARLLRAVLRAEALEHEARVEARRRLRDEPWEVGDAHVLRGPARRRELRRVLHEARGPERLAHGE